ncbi:hypothetical protein [Caulobacter sp. 17J65-9]|uniref:hypothetical protein n=1 Tax=Caulobacter sp. 17J65-9 TaxID=2709382 RepID=UPI0013C91434|nr:hypothetical protein [Caulobacter sp. 17J65-9]NEX92580.1 hypothetical protein [Caulobacter sp. 17J65-9]
MTAPARATPRLPAAYAAFVPVLERLSEPLLEVLYGQLEQFERLARPVDPRQSAIRGEFEGLGGLTLRGDIDHVVQSELLLRTEAPLEFLRRLAEGETVFHEKEYADPGARAVYRAMISVGPGAIGHGRIVALAALLFLARTAAQRRAELHWCFLPRAEGAVWFEAVSPNTVKRLLRAASFREMTAEDAEDAAAAWADLHAGELATGGLRPVDWMIGARSRGGALQGAENGLVFAVDAPRRGEPRTVELRVREGGREVSRAKATFPPDGVCVSALRTPLRPLAPPPTTGPSLPAPIRREPSGWAPQYFAMTSGKSLVVRMARGLLVLEFDNQFAVWSKVFIPLPADALLAGVRQRHGHLTMLLHRSRHGRETVQLSQVRLHGTPALAVEAEADVPARMFARQHAYAVPTLGEPGPALRFYSTHGSPFDLTIGTDRTMRMNAVHKREAILWSTGSHALFRSPRGVDVHKTVGGQVDAFLTGDQDPGGKLYGMALSRTDRSLAFALAPNTWTVARPAPADGSVVPSSCLKLELKPYETVISARIVDEAVVARIWSDARRGGRGDLRTLTYRGGQESGGREPMNLGDRALGVARIDIADDGGFWAVTTDLSGRPDEILHLRRDKSSSKPKLTAFDLATLSADAAQVETGVLDG